MAEARVPVGGRQYAACLPRLRAAINVFAPNGAALGVAEGPLKAANGQAMSFPGLWSLVFGNGDADKPLTTLFYTAGFADQTDGVFGKITVGTSTTAGGGY